MFNRVKPTDLSDPVNFRKGIHELYSTTATEFFLNPTFCQRAGDDNDLFLSSESEHVSARIVWMILYNHRYRPVSLSTELKRLLAHLWSLEDNDRHRAFSVECADKLYVDYFLFDDRWRISSHFFIQDRIRYQALIGRNAS